MQKVTFKNSRSLNLVGNYYPSDSNSIIIMCHGLASDKSRGGVFDTVCEDFHAEGFAVLAFDFSGCGESDDDTLTVEKQVDDLQCAIHFAKEKGHNQIGLMARSLGGLISLCCFSPEISAMVLLAPVTDRIYDSWYDRLSKEQMEELKEKKYFTFVKKHGPRKRVLVDKEMLTQREQINQKKLLKGVTCPVLILHSPTDTMISFTDSQNAMQYLSPDSQLESIEGADHWFHDHMDVAAKKSKEWFLKYL